LDFSRLRTGEIVAGIGGVALLVVLFFDWFGGGAEVSGNVLNGTATISHPGISGWDALTDLPGFLIIFTGVVGIKFAGLTAIGKRLNWGLRRGVFTLGMGWVATTLVLWRMVAGSPDLKVGIFLGLAAVVAVWVGAWLALQEDGWEPLIDVPGGRTRTTSASAPAATPPPAPAKTPPKSASQSSGSTATKKRTKAKKSVGRSGSKSKSSNARPSSTKKSTSSGSSAGKRSARAKKKEK
jgi:hypothetical protein